MREQKVTVGEGPPITATTPEQLEHQGTVDGAAAKASGIDVREGLAVVAKRLATEVGLVGNLVGLRHHRAVGEVNGKVVAASNELALASEALAAKEEELAETKDGHHGFGRLIVELFDARLSVSSPADNGSPDARDDFGKADSPNAAAEGGDAPTDPPERALRYAWRRDLPAWVVWLLLAVIAGAEFSLSARAFQSIREQEWLVLLLAGLVGSAIVTLAHRIGTNLAHLLEQPLRAKGRSPAKLVETAFELPALLVGIVGVAIVRSSYFRLVHIAIPTTGLVALQLMLSAAAIGITMAGHNEAADEIRDRGRRVDDLVYAVRKLRTSFLEAQQALVTAEGSLRLTLQEMLFDYGVQVSHVQRTFADHYLRAFNESAGVHLSAEALPQVAPPMLVAQAGAWLDAHPVGTVAHLEFPYSCAPGAQAAADGDETEDDVEKPDPQRTFDLAGFNEEEAAA